MSRKMGSENLFSLILIEQVALDMAKYEPNSLLLSAQSVPCVRLFGINNCSGPVYRLVSGAMIPDLWSLYQVF